jgi:hypothetical protein
MKRASEFIGINPTKKLAFAAFHSNYAKLKEGTDNCPAGQLL